MLKKLIIILVVFMLLLTTTGCNKSDVSDDTHAGINDEEEKQSTATVDSDIDNFIEEDKSQEAVDADITSSTLNDVPSNTGPYDLTISLNVDDQEFDVFAGTWETEDHALQFTIDATSDGYFVSVNIPDWDYKVENAPFMERKYTTSTVPENVKKFDNLKDLSSFRIQKISASFSTGYASEPHGSIEFFPLKLDNTLAISYHFERSFADPKKRYLDGETVSCTLLEDRQYSSEPDFSKSVGKWVEDRDPHKCYEIILLNNNEYGFRFSTSDGYMTDTYKLDISGAYGTVEIEETGSHFDDDILNIHYQDVYGKINLSVDRFGTPTLIEANLYSNNGESRVLGTSDSQLVPFTDDLYNFYWAK